MKKYPISEMFLSPQGEGLFAGQLQFFIRFAGCSVGKKSTDEERQRFTQIEGKEIAPYRETCTILDGRKMCCFVSGTRIPVISADKYVKKRAVGELVAGDKVVAWTKSGTVASAITCLENHFVPEEDLVSIVFQKPAGGNVFVMVTGDHRFLTVDYKWIEARDLTLNSELHHSVQFADVTKQKMSESRREGLKDGTIKSYPRSRKSRKLSRDRMLGENNPMKNPDAVERMMKNHWRRPTGPEKKVILLANDLHLPLKYTGANGFIARSAKGQVRNPDFIVVGTPKIVEVFDSSFHYMGKKRDRWWVRDTKRWYAQCGYDCLVVDVHKRSREEISEQLVKFVGNGLRVLKIQKGFAKGVGRRLHLNPNLVKKENGKRFVQVTELSVEHGNYLGPAGLVNHNCDTDFRTKEALTVEQILERIPEGVNHICLTGGEPLDHPLEALLQELADREYFVHIETSGTVNLTEKAYPSYRWQDSMSRDGGDGWLWITVSPKFRVLPEMLNLADEIKLLVDENFDVQKIPTEVLNHHLLFIQPINGEFEISRENMDRCLELQKKYPDWRISSQSHKLWKVR